MKLFFSILFLFPIIGWAQPTTHVTVQFEPSFLGQRVILSNKVYHLSANDSLVIETLRFYVSNISLLRHNQEVLADENPPRLIDLSNPTSLSFKIPRPATYNGIRFDLGVDSITNVSGALGGDLDPTKGMYWTWQSGYINLKIEGTSNLCPTRNNAFVFHLGGYNGLMNALQTVTIETANREHIRIQVPLDKFFKQIDLSKQNMVMTPGKEAVSLSAIFSRTFFTLTAE